MKAMSLIGTGKGVAALMNGRARRVTPRVIRQLAHALPDARILVSEDLAQARRHARTLAALRPWLVLSGGGDGTATVLVNLLREEGFLPLPALGLLKLGTGNGWANCVQAGPAGRLLAALPRLEQALPLQRFHLLEIEGRLATFAGVGWDARVLNDYLRFLDRRSSRLFGSRLAGFQKGLAGYLYAVGRISLPEELTQLLREGAPRLTVECAGAAAVAGPDGAGAGVTWRGPWEAEGQVLFEGPANAAIAGTSEEFGFRFRAFPHARARTGFLSLRVYDGTALDALLSAVDLWRGRPSVPGMHDFLVTAARLRCSRPLPFQIGGEAVGSRSELEVRVAREAAWVVDWRAALRAAAPAGAGLRRLLPVPG